jgi:DHA1 family tetracycline resistance protein-like MFS transporter
MYGRRVTFLVTGFGATIAYAGAIFSTSFYNLLICRALAGLLSGTVGNAFAYLADITSKEERAIYMSYMSAVMSSCFIVGPMIGGGLSIYGLRVPYLGATVFSGIVMVLTYTSLQEPSSLLMKKVELCKEDDDVTSKTKDNKYKEVEEGNDDDDDDDEKGKSFPGSR